jgi:Nuclease-related domain
MARGVWGAPRRRFSSGLACIIDLVIAAGVVVAVAVALHRLGKGAAADREREARQRRIGAVGEARVALDLARLGLPALRNVILCDDARSVELDHDVRLRSGIVVLETKTLRGVITGTLDGAQWTQRKQWAGEIKVRCLVNPVLQNRAHVRALEAFVGDRRVPVWGVVVSTGSASFAPEIADEIVGVDDLGWVLSAASAEADPRSLEAAWRRLEREAGKSPGRRAAHAAHVRRVRRQLFGADRKA